MDYDLFQCELFRFRRTPPKNKQTVVSPLISLIEDQTRYLNDLVPGSAAMLSAGMDKRETANVYRRMRGETVEGDPRNARLVMVLVTPEKVLSIKVHMAWGKESAFFFFTRSPTRLNEGQHLY